MYLKCDTKPTRTKVPPDVAFRLSGHMTGHVINKGFVSDGSQLRVRPKFARNKISDLTFSNKQAKDINDK